jgi:hypothetical protein
MKKIIITLITIISISGLAFAQDITQTIKGRVFDKITQEPIIGATIVLINSNPLTGTISNTDGEFLLEDIPVGRQSITFSFLGYESYLVNEILISSGKQVVLDVGLEEKPTELDEVIIIPKNYKEKPINVMATVSSRQFTVEETQRYAGGLNDPARLASSFAGVATPSIKSNGISVRGNSPSGLLWRIEGVEVPSPNHFADLTIAGAGLLTVLSSQMMSNSDFYTGAFPAEYGNATSGVFDIKLRTGNSSEREYTVQAGLLGLDFATEGPFKKGKKASYLFNYRYSTLAVIGPMLEDNSGILKYQDLSYKISLPTKKAGTFSLWGIGAYDGVDLDALDRDEWESQSDRQNSQTSMHMFATGVNHKTSLNSNTFLNTSLSITGSGLNHKEQRLNNDLQSQPHSNAKNSSYRMTLQSSMTRYFRADHKNQTGFYLNHLGYDLDIAESPITGSALKNLVQENGQSELFQFYSQSKIDLTPKLLLNAGFHIQYFRLNKEFSLEPRVALKYELNEKQDLALAYGLHSRIESLPIYFVDDTENQPNEALKLMKSNQFVLSYNLMLNENLKLSIEPYFQQLTNVPVAPDSYISTLNIENSLFFDEVLVSDGKGRNMGVDLSLERYLNKGAYYLFSASIFDSKYTARDGIQRNTRFNKNYVVNALIGKEWQVGKRKNNIFSANIRLNYLGGNRIESIDIQKSISQQDIVYSEANGDLSFSKKHPDTPITSFTVSYRKNKPKHSSVWSLQVLNLFQAEEYDKDIYNLKTNMIETVYSKTSVPNISYKIEF